MHSARIRTVLALLAASLALAACASVASASSRQYSLIQDDGLLLGAPAGASAAMDQFQTIGADIVKVAAHWRWVAPDVESSTRPNVDLSDPANYNWSVLDHAVKGIEQRGMTPWLMITAPAPDWASSRSNSVKQPGVWQPDPKAFGVFAEAIAKRYPEVRYWSLMNEPNFDSGLAPQGGARGVSLSAIHYRKMYVEGRSGLDRGGAGADQIVFGELGARALGEGTGGR